MKLVQVKEEKVVQWSLPTTGYLKDGSSVIGYDIFMRNHQEVAKEEGWLLLEDNPPKYNEETHYLMSDGYDIFEDKVVMKYKLENIPEPEITDEYVDEEKIAMAEAIIDLEMRLAELEKIQGGK